MKIDRESTITIATEVGRKKIKSNERRDNNKLKQQSGREDNKIHRHSTRNNNKVRRQEWKTE